MGQTRIPDFGILSPDESIQWIQKWGALKYSNREIRDSNFWEFIDDKIGLINSVGAMVIKPQDALGRAPVIEQYSSNISNRANDQKAYSRNSIVLARMEGLGFNIGLANNIDQQLLDFTALDGSGELAATTIITSPAGSTRLYPEKIHVNLSPDAARSGGSAQILIQSAGGAVLGRGAINDDHPHEIIDMCELAVVDEHVQIVITAGAVHLGAGKISTTSHFRVKT